jgi:8-oxo-dGTP pyrophosphatase MutT (NUDIX family)
MDKFSKLKPKTIDDKKDKELFSKGALKIIEFEDWNIVKTKDCIICIPILIETNQVVLRHEYIPTFKYVDGREYHATIVAGGIEPGEDPKTALLRELEEEAGIVLREDYDDFEELKPFFLTKGSANKAYPFLLPLNERDYQEVLAKGDGSKAESMSKSVKIDIKYLDSVDFSDLASAYMVMKAKEYLNLLK